MDRGLAQLLRLGEVAAALGPFSAATRLVDGLAVMHLLPLDALEQLLHHRVFRKHPLSGPILQRLAKRLQGGTIWFALCDRHACQQLGFLFSVSLRRRAWLSPASRNTRADLAAHHFAVVLVDPEDDVGMDGPI